MMHRIDSHQHFWQLSRGGYPWLIPELSVLYRDFMPQHLIPELRAAGVSQTLLVQAEDSLEETLFLLALAEKHTFVAGVVGWVDMLAADAPDKIHMLAQYRHFKGIRPMLQDIEDPDWILNPGLQPAFHALIEHDLTFDALIYPHHLTKLSILLTRYPSLNVVIDHAAKPDIQNQQFQPWAAQMGDIAQNSRACCKLSGLVTQAGRPATARAIKPYVTLLLEAFGSGRLMWGSDWPVLHQSGMDYQAWVAMCSGFLARLDKEGLADIWAGTARRFYCLDEEGTDE